MVALSYADATSLICSNVILPLREKYFVDILNWLRPEEIQALQTCILLKLPNSLSILKGIQVSATGYG